MGAAEKIVGPAFEVVCDSANRENWLEQRKFGVGASESAGILGHNPETWGSALEVWAVKLGKVERKDLEDSENVFWGNVLEPAIIRGYGLRTGRKVVPFGIMLRSTRWPWLTATPDALVSDGGSSAMSAVVSALRYAIANNTHVGGVVKDLSALALDEGWWPLQAKNIGFGSAEHWSEGVPTYYRIQCAHEALVFGSSRTTGAALVAGQRLVWDDIDVSLGGLLERQIVNLCRVFVENHLKTGVPPAPDASESARRALASLFPRELAGKQVVLGSAAMDRAYDHERAKESLRSAEKRVKELENAIKADMGDAEIAVYPDGSAHTLKTQTRNGSSFRVLRRKAAKGD